MNGSKRPFFLTRLRGDFSRPAEEQVCQQVELGRVVSLQKRVSFVSFPTFPMFVPSLSWQMFKFQ
jgi:hypothetical protein